MVFINFNFVPITLYKIFDFFFQHYKNRVVHGEKPVGVNSRQRTSHQLRNLPVVTSQAQK
jgi:hypothetical protein